MGAKGYAPGKGSRVSGGAAMGAGSAAGVGASDRAWVGAGPTNKSCPGWTVGAAACSSTLLKSVPGQATKFCKTLLVRHS